MQIQVLVGYRLITCTNTDFDIRRFFDHLNVKRRLRLNFTEDRGMSLTLGDAASSRRHALEGSAPQLKMSLGVYELLRTNGGGKKGMLAPYTAERGRQPRQ